MIVKRTTKIHSVNHRVVVLGTTTRETTGWCPECASEVKMIAPDLAAQILQVGVRTIYRAIEAGEVHFTETSDGLILICLNTLNRADDVRLYGPKL